MSDGIDDSKGEPSGAEAPVGEASATDDEADERSATDEADERSATDEADERSATDEAAPGGAENAGANDPRARPSFLFFGVLSGISLLADVGTKAWAELVLKADSPMNPKLLLGADPSIVLIKDHLTLTLAYNRGGAWGLLQSSPESIRRPFFLLVSVLAIAFIVSLYGRLAEGQRVLKWGLPLVLGGALGNLADRIVRSSVIDFIDYRAAWIESMNAFIARYATSWTVTDHWPTFNVADISICAGVALMGIDMITSRRHPERAKKSDPAESGVSPPTADATGGTAVASEPPAEPR